MGLVAQVFDEDALSDLHGDIAIGHTRYSTTGSTSAVNAQPFIAEGSLGQIALSHNGNVVNAQTLHHEMQTQGHNFDSSTDSEVIVASIAKADGKTWVEKVRNGLRHLSGAYSLALLTKDSLFAVRDPLGIRPLCLGRLNGGWVVASETCALDHLGAQFLREIEPGEVLRIDAQGITSFRLEPSTQPNAFCIFEYIYFARPDSTMHGKLLYQVRERMGQRLAEEHGVEADIVIGTPDSAIPAAIGYARASGIPYSEGLIKNRYVGRTFIQPSQRIRDIGVRLKFNPLPEVLRDKRVVVVDDSIVRGTTTPRVVSLLRKAGAKENPPAHLLPAYQASLLLWCGHGHQRRTYCRPQDRYRDQGFHRSRLPGLSKPGGPTLVHRRAAAGLLHRLSYGRLSGTGAIRIGQACLGIGMGARSVAQNRRSW